MEYLITEVAKLITNSRKTVALTGAGISVESGIPHFRGKDGIWEKYNPEEYATIDAFISNPTKIWHMLKELSEIIFNAEPNPAHTALADLENRGKLSSIITQNIDGLHQKAGNSNVIELHGNNRQLLCMNCQKSHPSSREIIEKIPPLCTCGGILRPDVVFFGESLPSDALRKASQEASTSDLMLVIGTSAVVYPASTLPLLARGTGAKIIEINPEETPLTSTVSDFILKGKAEEVMPSIVEAMKGELVG